MITPQCSGLLFAARTHCKSRIETRVDEAGKTLDYHYTDEEFTIYLRTDTGGCALPLETVRERPWQLTYYDGSIWILDRHGILRLADNQRIPLTSSALFTLEGRLCALSKEHGLFEVQTGKQYIAPELMKEQSTKEGLHHIDDACVHNERIVVLGGFEKKGRYGYTEEYFTISKDTRKQWILKHACVHPLTNAVAEPFCGSDATPDHIGIVRSIHGYLYSRNAWCGPITVQKDLDDPVLSEIQADNCVAGMAYDSQQKTLYVRCINGDTRVQAGKIPEQLQRRENIKDWERAEIFSRKEDNTIELKPKIYHKSTMFCIQYNLTSVLHKVTSEEVQEILQRHAKEAEQDEMFS